MRSDLNFDNKPVDERLMELKVSVPNMEFHIMVKCFNMLNDKLHDKSRHYRAHCGEHTVIAEECINSCSFRPMLDDCLERALELWTTQNTINVVCCDSQGIHRSVAIAYILCAVFQVKGYKAAGPYHLCKGQWRNNAICSRCPKCQPHEEKLEMFSAAASSL